MNTEILEGKNKELYSRLKKEIKKSQELPVEFTRFCGDCPRDTKLHSVSGAVLEFMEK